MTAKRILSEGFVSVSEAARYLGVNKSLVYSFVSGNVLTHIRVGHRVTVSRAALEQYAKERLVMGAVA